jgi:hypothetical protein
LCFKKKEEEMFIRKKIYIPVIKKNCAAAIKKKESN